MSEGLLKVADLISVIGDRAATATAQLKDTLAAQQAVNAAKPASSGSTTATNEGYGLPGQMMAALKLFEGRT